MSGASVSSRMESEVCSQGAVMGVSENNGPLGSTMNGITAALFDDAVLVAIGVFGALVGNAACNGGED
jgi:hypothetical protein